MKAAVIKAPNSDVHIEERDRPSPGRGEVLIRVHACGVCHGDLMLQMGQFPFARYPWCQVTRLQVLSKKSAKMSANCGRATALGCRHFSHPAAAASNASIGTSFFVLKCNLPASRKTAGISSSCSRLLLMSPSFRMG